MRKSLATRVTSFLFFEMGGGHIGLSPCYPDEYLIGLSQAYIQTLQGAVGFSYLANTFFL